VERRSTCNPFDYLSVSTPRQGALAPAPRQWTPFPAEEAGAPSRDDAGRIRAGQAVVTPLHILRLRCFLLRSPH
jgi:hypothetical protein